MFGGEGRGYEQRDTCLLFFDFNSQISAFSSIPSYVLYASDGGSFHPFRLASESSSILQKLTSDDFFNPTWS